MLKSDSRFVLAGALVAWGLLSTCFIVRTPDYAFSHDLGAHFQYTRILVQEHRFPHPYEGQETFEPPLFYWLASHTFAKQPFHPRAVRFGSALCGLIGMGCIAWILRYVRSAPLTQLFLLLFIGTTPEFLFLFSTYSNDALAAACSMLLVVLTVAIVQKESLTLYAAWTLSATAGFYTKYTVLFTAVLLLGLCAIMFFRGKVPPLVVARLAGCLALALGLLSPWMLGHNYRLTGRLFPLSHVIEDPKMPREIMLPHSAWRTVITPPGFTPGEWRDPFVHLWEATGHKKGSFLAYQLSSSVFGEFVFDHLPSVLPWTILVIHVLFLLGGLRSIPINGTTRLASLSILGALLNGMSYIFYFPLGGLMDFRYIMWTWIPFSVLVAAIISSLKDRWVVNVWLSLLGLGALLQTLFLRLLMQ